MHTRTQENGFSLVEVLIVLGIFSMLSVMMVYSVSNARQIGLATQNAAVAGQSGRLVMNIIERDIRLIGTEIFENIYRVNNGGQAGELVQSQPPEFFNYELGELDLEGFMVPPIEVTNGTDSPAQSYLLPIEDVFGITAEYREPGTDLVTIFYGVDTGFSGIVDDVTGQGQENFIVNDQAVGQRAKNIFDQQGGDPVLVLVIDDEGQYSTFRTVTQIAVNNDEYRFKMEPSNDFNQPSNFKGFLEDIGYDFKGPGGPDLFRQTVAGDTFMQVMAVTYLVYSNPSAAGAQGWLVRLELGAITSSSTTIDATDPETLRPFVVSEHISDFQVAFGIDSDEDGEISTSEWHNDNTMENYIHTTPGEDSVSADFLDLINNLRAFRFSIVAHTDASSEDNPFAFPDSDDADFSSLFPSVQSVADKIGVSVTLEDRTWGYTELVDRLWYRKAYQFTKSNIIRNLDLENAFAREQ